MGKRDRAHSCARTPDRCEHDADKVYQYPSSIQTPAQLDEDSTCACSKDPCDNMSQTMSTTAFAQGKGLRLIEPDTEP